jgi:hypothetical protein
VRDWVDWREYLAGARAARVDFERSIEDLRATTPTRRPTSRGRVRLEAQAIVEVGREIGAAGSAFASHVWRNAAAGNEGGWQVARNLQFVSCWSAPSARRRHQPAAGQVRAAPFTASRAPQDVWSELLYPREWPLSHHELSFLLPHFLLEERPRQARHLLHARLQPGLDQSRRHDVDRGAARRGLVGCHAALTPTWSETARWADYVLPMGVAPSATT